MPRLKAAIAATKSASADWKYPAPLLGWGAGWRVSARGRV